jgi:hypothetical protein
MATTSSTASGQFRGTVYRVALGVIHKLGLHLEPGRSRSDL